MVDLPQELRRSSPQNQRARLVFEVALQRDRAPAGLPEAGGRRFGLVVADFDDGHSVRRREAAEIGGQCAIGGEPIRAAVEGGTGIVIADFGGERPDCAGGDVGRIRNDEIEAAGERRAPVAAENGAAAGKAASGEIFPRDPAGRFLLIHADPQGARKFTQQRAKQCAGAGAEIEDAQRVAATISQRLERGGNQRLRIGTRVEHVGGDAQREIPEFAPAKNARHRLALEPPFDKGLQPRRRLLAEPRIGIAQQRGVIDISRLAEQHARIALRRLDAGVCQQSGGAVVRVGIGESGGHRGIVCLFHLTALSSRRGVVQADTAAIPTGNRRLASHRALIVVTVPGLHQAVKLAACGVDGEGRLLGVHCFTTMSRWPSVAVGASFPARELRSKDTANPVTRCRPRPAKPPDAWSLLTVGPIWCLARHTGDLIMTVMDEVQIKVLGAKEQMDELNEYSKQFAEEIQVERYGIEKDPTNLKFGLAEVASWVAITKGAVGVTILAKKIFDLLRGGRGRRIIIQTPMRRIELISSDDLTAEEVQDALTHIVKAAK